MSSKLKEKEGKHTGGGPRDDIVLKGVLAAAVIGVIVTLILVVAIREDSYSALYLEPDSYSNYLEDNNVAFTYGVQCFENEKTRYGLQVFIGENIISKKEFTLERDQELKDDVAFDIPGDIEFPAKVMLLLTTNNQNYSTHFWLKGRK